MLTELQLNNFKSWRETGAVRLAPITAFFGTNSSGKTSLLQSLLLLRQTTESSDRNRVLDLGRESSLVDLGTPIDIYHAASAGEDMSIKVSWSSEKSLEVLDPLQRERHKTAKVVTSRDLSLTASISIAANRMSVSEFIYGLGDTSFGMKRREKSKNNYELYSDGYDFVRATGRVWPLPAPTRFYGFPDQVRVHYQNAGFLSDLELAFEDACSRIRYLGPLRDDPRRQYTYSGAGQGDVGRRGELAVDALVASRLSGGKVSRGFGQGERRRRLPAVPVEQLVAEWLRELGLIDSFEVEALDDRETVYRIRVRRSPSSPPVMLTDVGFGISQVLPVLVLLAMAKDGDTVVLEQPEIHLHPAVQSGLADIILETALARNVQVILESHSEHLLTRLQRRIAEETLGRSLSVTPADVALYFCTYSGAASNIAALEMDAYGNINNWPNDFFGDPMEDSLAMVQAMARRVTEGD